MQTVRNSNSGKFLTRKEAARILRISLDTLDDHITTKKLRAFRIGKRVLLKPEDLEKALTEM